MSLSFDEVIQKYRKNATSTRDQGDKFERLIKAYFESEALYKSVLSDVWLWKDFPYKNQFGRGNDVGIDIVCRTKTGEYWAIQCKLYGENETIDYKAIATFYATSDILFKTKDGEKKFENRIWVDTTLDGFTGEAESKIQKLNISRIGLSELRKTNLNWEDLDSGKSGDEVQSVKYGLRPHQQEALDKAKKYYETHDRGKLIMACGTGKTFTSLRIAEQLANDTHIVLFFVPSITLLNQSLKEWTEQAYGNIYPICICSDASASRLKEDAISDLVLPATTDTDKVKNQFLEYRKRLKSEGGMIVVFSTYQSIDVVIDTQARINSEEKDSFIFDLIICDEAHRTTGIKQKGQNESKFTKVHSNNNIKAKKRMYMTATPRLYSSEAREKAKESEVYIWSMDDPAWYGEEFYRIGFGAAVEKQLLSDYKVLVLTLNEKSIDVDVPQSILKKDSGIKEADAIKIIGCINALSKRTKYFTDRELFSDVDPEPMRSAVAFSSSIKNSKYLRDCFKVCQEAYYETMGEEERADLVVVEAKHVDGTMGSTDRENKLEWLKSADPSKNECHLLNNVRCLSEGVDVPSLDAIIFLSSRNSQVDVVQSVGRVMRRAEGKKFGYIIIPVVVSANTNADKILEDSEDYQIVWSVLNALRAHDDRFNAIINKIELNRHRPKNIRVVGGGKFYSNKVVRDGTGGYAYEESFEFDDLQEQLYEQFDKLSNQVFAKMVVKCGNRRYWADWGKDVGEIAKRNIERINKLISEDGEQKEKFEVYWDGLKKNLNPSINKQEAVEMLAQHMITKPVFEALFGNDHFTKENPVSKTLEDIVSSLDKKTDPADMGTLERFYQSVAQRAEGIDNAEAKQKIVKDLYESFFRNAFPKTVEKLGIVYTPVEVVDFILHSTEYVLNKEFGRSISNEKVNVIDPFTGTGTFVTRLLQSGIIKKKDLERKYKNEIFANEIVLLAYYIASINIENVYHELSGTNEYEPLGGICLTDTFQLYENQNPTLNDKVFVENSDRVNKQKEKPITVIIGNPPYSVGQKSANDNAQNQKYNKLENRIAETYCQFSKAQLNRSVYDSYIKAFRWASDRLDKTDGGVIAFVSNGGWLDGNGLDGFRKSIEDEFNSIYVFNLKGNCRTSGELRKKEGGNVFGIGTRTPVSITILVKKPEKSDKANIMYHDIGEYLSREQKLKIISDFHDVSKLPMIQLNPNEHGDWISQRNEKFGTWIPIEADKKFNENSESFFITYAIGVCTSRDSWVYNFSSTHLKKNIGVMIDFYNKQRESYVKQSQMNPSIDVDDTLEIQPSKISWSRGIKNLLKKNEKIIYQENDLIVGIYRPFMKQNLCFSEGVIEMPGINKKLFPTPNHDNLVICVTGNGSTKDSTALITNMIPCYDYVEKSQCFPLYWYESTNSDQKDSVTNHNSSYIKHDGISDYILERAKQKYGNKPKKLDIFWYVYGILHSKSYREKFTEDLKKSLPRIPLVGSLKEFDAFREAGKNLGQLHLNYEDIPRYPDVVVEGEEKNNFKVEKMKFLSKDRKDTIIYNKDITISNIPSKAYEYIVNGKSAIEWIMERYAITTHKESGITNDPNDWATEHNKPRYILDLLLSIINVSVQTVDIVNSLPKIDWDKE